MTVKASSRNQIITSNLVGAATIVLGSNTWGPKTRVVRSRFFSTGATLNSFSEQNRLLNRVFSQLLLTILSTVYHYITKGGWVGEQVLVCQSGIPQHTYNAQSDLEMNRFLKKRIGDSQLS